MNIKQDLYHSLLMEYASGCLDEGQSLVIAAHMALSPLARKTVAEYESIGGSILDDCCGEVAMKSDALKRVMDKIDCSQSSSPCAAKNRKKSMSYLQVPNCLQGYVESAAWKMDNDGRQTIHIKTHCHHSRARMYKIDPETSFHLSPRSSHQIILVLEGSFHDDKAIYRRGDLIVINGQSRAVLHSDPEQGCICIIGHPSAFNAKAWIRKIFVRF